MQPLVASPGGAANLFQAACTHLHQGPPHGPRSAAAASPGGQQWTGATCTARAKMTQIEAQRLEGHGLHFEQQALEALTTATAAS